MPDASVEIRVYCICGQKMKVTEDMFGLPAKCVACRRRIRIPAREDVAPDAHEIFLKDHPELFRKHGKPRKTLAILSRPVAAEAKMPDSVVVPVCAAEHASKVSELQRPLPLDTLEQLREIVSLRNKVLRELRKLKDGGVKDAEHARAALKSDLQRLDKARVSVDSQIREKRGQVETELTAIREKIVQTSLLARLEEITFNSYQEMVDRLRRRRDMLERLRYDLCAWLDIRDPRAAGGYVSRSFDQIPPADIEVQWPQLAQDGSPLLEQHTQGLREGFAARERAKVKLEETARLRSEGAASGSSVANLRADAKIEKRKAEAEITHRRKRLEEFGQDTAGDAQTIQACLERARKRLEGGALEPPAFEALEQELLRAQRDCARAHDVVARALVAANAKTVPDPKGSYIGRLGGRLGGRGGGADADVRPGASVKALLEYDDVGMGLDSWIAWSGALMLALSVFLPVVGELSPLQTCRTLAFQGHGIYWVMAAPILSAAAIVAAGALPRRRARGFLLLSLWFALTLLGVLVFHESRYSNSAAAERFLGGSYWLMRPGVALMLLANVTLLAAAVTALCAKRLSLLAVAVAVAAAAGAGAVVRSDFMGVAVAEPSVTINSRTADDFFNPAAEVQVAVSNNGRRSLFLTSVQSPALNAFVFKMQRQTAPTAWQDVAMERIRLTGVDLGAVDIHAPSHFRTITVKPGAAADFSYTLPPGEYRVLMVNANVIEPFVSGLTISAPDPPPQPEPPPEPDFYEAIVDQPPPPVVYPALETVEIEMKGIIIGPNREPRFAIVLHAPGKAPESVDAIIGDTIHGEWVASEYNPSRQTLTMTNGDEVRIVARGRKTALAP